MIPFKLLGFLTTLFLLTEQVFSQTVIDRDEAEEAAAWCAAKNVTGTVEQFAICTSGTLSKAELKRCVEGTSCFGVNFKAIDLYGPCGGRNSLARKLLGNSVCRGDLCRGPKSAVTYYNETNTTIRPKVKGQCDSREDRDRLHSGEGITWSDTGESHFWVWTGGVSSPRDRCGRDGKRAQAYTDVSGGKFKESPRAGKWKLKTGRVYEFQKYFNCVVPIDVTPVFKRRSRRWDGPSPPPSICNKALLPPSIRAQCDQ